MVGSVKVLAFAGARDVVGADAISWPLSKPCTVEAFVDALCESFPRLGPHRASIRLAINGKYAAKHDVVSVGDEVALIPPVAGG